MNEGKKKEYVLRFTERHFGKANTNRVTEKHLYCRLGFLSDHDVDLLKKRLSSPDVQCEVAFDMFSDIGLESTCYVKLISMEEFNEGGTHSVERLDCLRSDMTIREAVENDDDTCIDSVILKLFRETLLCINLLQEKYHIKPSVEPCLHDTGSSSTKSKAQKQKYTIEDIKLALGTMAHVLVKTCSISEDKALDQVKAICKCNPDVAEVEVTIVKEIDALTDMNQLRDKEPGVRRTKRETTILKAALIIVQHKGTYSTEALKKAFGDTAYRTASELKRALGIPFNDETTSN